MKTTTIPATTALRWRDLTELTKSGITSMVVVSAAVGLLLATEEPLAWTLWFHTLVGTALVSAGASALNQVVEREADSRMRRTAQRPLPAGRMATEVGWLVGLGCAAVGAVQLYLGANALAAGLAVGTLVGYVFVYTPLKRASSLATVVGAVPGAVPPLIGWAAARGSLGTGAWILFALLFFWQMPHFLAIAWLYRADYERGGFPMLSVGDPDGLRTGRQAVLYCAALVPVSLLPSVFDLAGAIYFGGALLAGGVFLLAASRFALDRSPQRARRLMVVSILYLPVVLALLVIDRWI